MSDIIPIMPQPEIIDNWVPSEVRPHPGKATDEVVLMTITHEELETETPTLQDIQAEIERMVTEDELPKYDFYYWVIQSTLSAAVNTGLLSNKLWSSSTQGNFVDSQIVLNKYTDDIEFRMYFIYHPLNYTTSATNSKWFIGICKDDSDAEMRIFLKSTSYEVNSYISDPENSLPCTNLALMSWTGTSSQTMYPPIDIQIWGSNRLPLSNN